MRLALFIYDTLAAIVALLMAVVYAFTGPWYAMIICLVVGLSCIRFAREALADRAKSRREPWVNSGG